MANNQRVSRSASLEDLREKNSQMEAEMSKLAEDVREVMRRQEESSRKHEESSRALDDKLSNLGLMMERTLCQINGKGHVGETSNSNGINKVNGDGISRNLGNGIEGDSNFDLNSEEMHSIENHLKNRERIIRSDSRRTMQFPKMDFPCFDGNEPRMWQTNCEFYFEMYEVPEVYETRMAVMNFSEEIHEWYRSLTTGHMQLPWELLVEEVMARFQSQNVRNPVDEFKRVHQIGKVEDYIRKFERSKSRLLLEKPTIDEGFFVAGFISGLRGEIKHIVELFNPRTINNAFQCALKVETALETQHKRPKEVSRNFKYQKPVNVTFKQKSDAEKPVVKEGQYRKPWQQRANYQNPTYEQRKELGLCHKCHDKYFPGHQCAGRVLKISADSDSDLESSEEERECLEQVEGIEEVVEQAMISMFTGNDKQKMNSMKFKGHIGKLPICALLDSGSLIPLSILN